MARSGGQSFNMICHGGQPGVKDYHLKGLYDPSRQKASDQNIEFKFSLDDDTFLCYFCSVLDFFGGWGKRNNVISRYCNVCRKRTAR